MSCPVILIKKLPSSISSKFLRILSIDPFVLTSPLLIARICLSLSRFLAYMGFCCLQKSAREYRYSSPSQTLSFTSLLMSSLWPFRPVMYIWATTWQNQQNECAPSEDISAWACPGWSEYSLGVQVIFILPRKLCLWGAILFSRCPSVRDVLVFL